MGYSRRVDKNYKLKELKKFLNSSSKIPTAIPYTTSYYKDNFGFNISHNEKKNLKQGQLIRHILTLILKKGNLLIRRKNLKRIVKKDFFN